MNSAQKANQQIILAETRITAVNGKAVNKPACVVHRLSPSAGVVVKSDELPAIIIKEGDIYNDTFEIELENDARVNVIVGSHTPGTFRGALVPVTQPCVVIDTGELPQSVEFRVLNFRQIFGQHDSWTDINGQSYRSGVARFEAGPWIAEISSVPDLSEVVKTLRADGGCAVTHTGKMERSDGAGFSAEQAADFLAVLRSFLSFAHGAFCGIAGAVGKDQDGDKCWERWGSLYTTPWSNMSSCLGGSYLDGGALSSLFSRWWCLVTKDDTWKACIERSVDWYLNSEESAMHVGIILSQAALECLSHKILGRGRNQGEKTGGFIRSALAELKIDTCVPSSCPNLTSMQPHSKRNDGPGTLVKIRNNWIHPENKYGPYPLEIQRESQSLAQWYIELMLLKLLEYDGRYWNRLTARFEDMP